MCSLEGPVGQGQLDACVDSGKVAAEMLLLEGRHRGPVLALMRPGKSAGGGQSSAHPFHTYFLVLERGRTRFHIFISQFGISTFVNCYTVSLLARLYIPKWADRY